MPAFPSSACGPPSNAAFSSPAARRASHRSTTSSIEPGSVRLTVVRYSPPADWRVSRRPILRSYSTVTIWLHQLGTPRSSRSSRAISL
jgi:hypothetical protein